MDEIGTPESLGSVKKDKPSRWWMAYHLWCGLCFKTFVDISGLSKIFVGSSSSNDPASASASAGLVGLLTAATVALGYFLSLTITKAIDSASFSAKIKKTAKVMLPFAYFAGAVLLSIAIGPLIASPTISPAKSSPATASSEIKPVLVYTTVQSAEGVKEADLTQEGLKNLEDWVTKTILKKSKDKYTEMGYDPKDFNPNVTANSVYVNAGGKKLAIIKVDMDNSMKSVTVMGIKGDELHRVACIRGSNHDIPVWSGECGNKIEEVFGVSVRP